VKEDSDYLYVTYKSPLFGFVDDGKASQSGFEALLCIIK